MLNGIAPLIIFNFPPKVPGDSLFKSLAGLPIIGSTLGNIGIPIPLYLDEGLTGLMIESETKAIDVDTDIVPSFDKINNVSILVNQSGINNLVTVNMLASKDSVGLAALSAFCDMIFDRLIKTKYTVTYLNKSTTVFGGYLHSFSTSVNSNDDLIKVILQIQKPNENKPTFFNQFYNPQTAPPAPVPIPNGVL